MGRRAIIDFSTLIVTFCVVSVTGLVAWRTFHPPPPATFEREDRVISGFEELVSVGHRVGAEQPLLTILEFGDYECPACRGAEPHVEAILRKYPAEVAVIRRHFPLSYHQNAYRAAVAAECAAAQGRFETMHASLYAATTAELAERELTSLTVRAGVPDQIAFVECLIGSRGQAAVDRDLASAEALELGWTPSFIVNGVLLGSSPDSVRFEELLLDARREHGRSQ